MNPSSRRYKTPAKLAESTQQRLAMYALAASAAGVGVLALAQSAEAKIIYTPAHHLIGANQTYRIDLNHDGIPDFMLFNFYTYGSGAPDGAVGVVPKRRANEVWAAQHCSSAAVFLCAAALPKGTKIGPKGRFLPVYPSGEIMAASNIHGYRTGSWFDMTRYLGLKFVIKGTMHFGWARVSVSAPKNFKFTATLLGYAYETIPNKPIIAGATKGPDEAEPTASLNTPTHESATLGTLALGASGLSIWRREESVLASSGMN
jgi:hypothetical protein